MARGRVQDYRWSVGLTPFGDLSNEKTLPQTIHFTARRNYILAQTAQLMQHMHEFYLLFARLSMSGHPSVRHPFFCARLTPESAVQEVFSKELLSEFYCRSNVFRSKVAVVLTHVGRGEVEIAHYYARSSQHEVKAMEALRDDLQSSGPQAVLMCHHKRGRLIYWLAIPLAAAAGVIWWLMQRLRPIRKKLD